MLWEKFCCYCSGGSHHCSLTFTQYSNIPLAVCCKCPNSKSYLCSKALSSTNVDDPWSYNSTLSKWQLLYGFTYWSTWVKYTHFSVLGLKPGCSITSPIVFVFGGQHGLPKGGENVIFNVCLPPRNFVKLLQFGSWARHVNWVKMSDLPTHPVVVVYWEARDRYPPCYYDSLGKWRYLRPGQPMSCGPAGTQRCFNVHLAFITSIWR